MSLALRVLAVLGGIALYTLLYEFVRHRVQGAVARRWRRTVRTDFREHGGALERSRFAHKQLVRLELLADLELNQAMLEAALAGGASLDALRDRVEDYIDEIVPFFNLLSFYKVAHPIGRAALSMTYDLVVDPAGLERIRALPAGANVVFVFNHRSNADFVIANTIFAHEVAISFAVGEWARVWPLDALFRSFGSYFVRRGEKDPLYHKVLERYVQLVTRGGLSQGFFIEGGLSRDGRLREPKIGILSYILGAKRDPAYARDILFVPVGLGYDRVIEDFRLLAEARGAGERRGFLVRLASLLVVGVQLLPLAVVNAVRVLRGRWRRFGHAAIRFGEPISAAEWLAGVPDLWTEDAEARKGHLKDLAGRISKAIGRAIPATPVPIVALALDQAGGRIAEDDLEVRVAEMRRRLVAAGAPILLGPGFEKARADRREIEAEREERRGELLDVEADIVRADEDSCIARIGLGILRSRRIVRRRDGWLEVDPKRAEYLRYYANTIAHHLDGGA